MLNLVNKAKAAVANLKFAAKELPHYAEHIRDGIEFGRHVYKSNQTFRWDLEIYREHMNTLRSEFPEPAFQIPDVALMEMYLNIAIGHTPADEDTRKACIQALYEASKRADSMFWILDRCQHMNRVLREEYNTDLVLLGAHNLRGLYEDLLKESLELNEIYSRARVANQYYMSWLLWTEKNTVDAHA